MNTYTVDILTPDGCNYVWTVAAPTAANALDMVSFAQKRIHARVERCERVLFYAYPEIIDFIAY